MKKRRGELVEIRQCKEWLVNRFDLGLGVLRPPGNWDFCTIQTSATLEYIGERESVEKLLILCLIRLAIVVAGGNPEVSR